MATLLAHLNDDPSLPFSFEHEGTVIVNPCASSCGRFSVTPEEYGFTVWQTGGNCTAWGREFVLPDGRNVVMHIGSADGSGIDFDPACLNEWGVSIVTDDGASFNYQLADADVDCGYVMTNISDDSFNA